MREEPPLVDPSRTSSILTDLLAVDGFKSIFLLLVETLELSRAPLLNVSFAVAPRPDPKVCCILGILASLIELN